MTIKIVVAIVLAIDKAFNIAVIIAINLVITWLVTSLWQLKCGSENVGYTLNERENKRDSTNSRKTKSWSCNNTLSQHQGNFMPNPTNTVNNLKEKSWSILASEFMI